MKRPLACGALAVSVLAAVPLPAAADEEVLRAMFSLIASQPPSHPVPGRVVNGSIVIENRSGDASFVGVFAPGPGLCIVRLHSIRQSKTGWAESGTVAFDFTKVKRVRWLSETDDPGSAPSRSAEAQDVRLVAIDGETPWVCRDIVNLAAERPAYDSTCYKAWTVSVPTPEDRIAAAGAIQRVEKSCVSARR